MGTISTSEAFTKRRANITLTLKIIDAASGETIYMGVAKSLTSSRLEAMQLITPLIKKILKEIKKNLSASHRLE